MTRGRLEAFSDGVIAILITIMVLELRPPHGTEIADLRPLLPVFLSYVLSYIFIGIYWSNHHHLLHVVRYVNGPVLWANLHLLFWLSLIPFVTAWMGENHFAALPVAAYGAVLLCAAISYYILTRALLAVHETDSPLARALGNDFKGRISIVIYVAAIGLCWLNPLLSCALYVLVAAMWLVPDRRMERVVEK
ncbi:MAG TPA: TMEM175 family protein [Candidatus Udaeobacter sp.]|nr:TMEM175 family protein [Candidatus Udaeobacter sp.]